MTKLKKYNTIEEWETAKGDFVYPKVGLIKKDNSVVYMTPLPPIHTLPIKAVFYDSSNGSFVKLYPDQIIEANPNYTPIGVEVIPAEHDVYGTGQAGIMSLAEMNCDTPDVGSSDYQEMLWSGSDTDTSIPNYDRVNYIGTGTTLNDGVVQGTVSSANLPSDLLSAVAGLDGKSGYYGSSTSYSQAPSPFNADGSRNEAYYTTAYSTANSLSDFDGVGNTKVLTDLATGQSNWKTADTIQNEDYGGRFPAACCCWRFHTLGTEQGQWYLPACGEFGYVINRILAINTTINKVLSVYSSVVAVGVNTSASYWSSSEWGYDVACRLRTSNGFVFNGKHETKYQVRAFFRL